MEIKEFSFFTESLDEETQKAYEDFLSFQETENDDIKGKCTINSDSWHWKNLKACMAWILSWHYEEELEYYKNYPDSIESAARIYRFSQTFVSLIPDLDHAGLGTTELTTAYIYFGIKNNIPSLSKVISLICESNKDKEEKIIFEMEEGRGLPQRWYKKAKLISGDVIQAKLDLSDALKEFYDTLCDMGMTDNDITFDPFHFPKSDKPWEQDRNDEEMNMIAAVLLSVVDDPGLYGNGPAGAVAMLQNKEFFDELCLFDDTHPVTFFTRRLNMFFDEELDPVRKAAIRHLLPFS